MVEFNELIININKNENKLKKKLKRYEHFWGFIIAFNILNVLNLLVFNYYNIFSAILAVLIIVVSIFGIKTYKGFERTTKEALRELEIQKGIVKEIKREFY